MGARLGFADVLLRKLADAPPPVVLGRLSEPRIASPSWVHRLEPLRVASATVLHQRYPQPASAAPAAAGIPVEAPSASSRRGAQASSSSRQARPLRIVKRSARERMAIQLLNRLGASIAAGASDEDVRSAYRQLVLETHPDRHIARDTHTNEARTQRFRTVVHAWQMFQGGAQ